MIDRDEFARIDPELDQAVKAMIADAPLPKLLGLEVEETRDGYSRMRMHYKPEINNIMGIVHGGATASLIDTAVVGALYTRLPSLDTQTVTVDMHIHYLDAGMEEDLIAHAAVRRSGRTMIYLEVDVYGDKSGKLIAHGELGYLVLQPRNKDKAA